MRLEVRTTIGGWARADRAQLGDRHRGLGQQLEQERLELVVGAVELVDQQHGRQRARVLDRLAAAAGGPGTRRPNRSSSAELARRRPRRAGSAAAGAGSSTRRAPRRRRCPRSTAAGSAACPSAAASALAASVLPTPASPSSSSGCGSRSGEEQRRGQALVGEVVHAVEPRGQRAGVGTAAGTARRRRARRASRRLARPARPRSRPRCRRRAAPARATGTSATSAGAPVEQLPDGLVAVQRGRARRRPRARTRTGARARPRSGRPPAARRRARRAAPRTVAGRRRPAGRRAAGRARRRAGRARRSRPRSRTSSPRRSPSLTTTSAPPGRRASRTSSALAAERDTAAGRSRRRARWRARGRAASRRRRAAAAWAARAAASRPRPARARSDDQAGEPGPAALAAERVAGAGVSADDDAIRTRSTRRGVPAAGGERRGARCDDLGEDRQRDLGARARADVQPGRRAHARAQLLRHVERSASSTAAPRARASDQPDVRARRPSSARGERGLLVAAVRGDHQRGVAGLGVRRRCRPPRSRAAAAELRQRPGDRRVARRPRRAARAAAARGRSRARRRSGTGWRRRPRPRSSLGPVLGSGHDPQQQRLAGLEHAQRRAGARVASAHDAADEALDRAVGEHERRVARRARWSALRAHDRRLRRTATPAAAQLARRVGQRRGRSLRRRRPSLHRLPHARRRARHVDVVDAVAAASASTTALTIAGGEPTVGGLADALGADRVVRRRRDRVPDLPVGHLHRASGSGSP